jgi:hypothetical protein
VSQQRTVNAPIRRRSSYRYLPWRGASPFHGVSILDRGGARRVVAMVRASFGTVIDQATVRASGLGEAVPRDGVVQERRRA